MTVYAFNDRPAAIKNANLADAQALGDEIEALGEGRTPDQIWRWAQGNPGSSLFQHFEWDLKKAAEAHWTATARKIVTMLVVVDNGGNRLDPAPYAFFSAREKPGSNLGYFTRSAVISNEYLCDYVRKEAASSLLAWERRYYDLEAACKEVSKIRKTLEDEE
jgi:hypothetical protein